MMLKQRRKAEPRFDRDEAGGRRKRGCNALWSIAAVCALAIGVAFTANAAHGSVPIAAAAVLQLDESVPSVESGRKALKRGSYPWYDSKADDVRPVDVKPAPAHDYHLPDLAWLQWLAWTLIAAVLIAIVYFLIRAFLNLEAPPAADTAAIAASHIDPDRVEALPFLGQRSTVDLLGQARWHYERGNYGEAIVFLFSYQLLQLDTHGVIRLAKGKTNRQYLREISSGASLRQLIERTMVSFEDVFFGQHALDRAQFEDSWNRLSEFDRLVAGAPA